MKIQELREKAGEKFRRLGGCRYVFLVIALGVILLVWPGETTGEEESESVQGEAFSLAETEEKLEKVLGQIDGVGRVSVALSVKNGMEYVLARDSDLDDGEERQETVILSAGSGVEKVVIENTIYPTYQGALVVCQGGGDPEIRLAVVCAVAALTGLSTARITVCSGGN